MKIILDNRVLKHTLFTGVERYTSRLFLTLKNLFSADYEFIDVEPKTYNRYFQHLWVYLKLPFLASRYKGDVLICTAGAAPFFLSSSIKLIVVVHDISFITNRLHYSGLFSLYYRLVLPLIFKRANALITVSSTQRDIIASYFPSVDCKLTFAYPGLDSIFLNSYQFHSKTKKKNYILAVGSLNKHKNFVCLLRAFKHILNDTDHDLYIVAHSRDLISKDNEFTSIINSIPKHRYKVFEFCSDEELVMLYAQADLFVFPSIVEGFGAVPLEAMSCGTPVVASNASVIPEVCSNAALYFDPYSFLDLADKILTILNDPILKSSLIEKGLDHSKNFTYEKTALSFTKVINDL